jgi:hypothetical protein
MVSFLRVTSFSSDFKQFFLIKEKVFFCAKVARSTFGHKLKNLKKASVRMQFLLGISQRQFQNPN